MEIGRSRRAEALKVHFPSPRNAPHDVIALSNDLSTATLLDAYSKGIFPWPVDEETPIVWFSPRRRAVLDFDRLRIGRTLRKEIRRSRFELTIDAAFDRVMQHCAEIPRPDQDGTWILPEMIDAYRRLHRSGHAHSVEVWDGERLVGGLYGVDPGGAFSGESMFHLEDGASKIALLALVDRLRAHGQSWIDVQVMTPHMARLGARFIGRSEFLDRLEEALSAGRKFWSDRVLALPEL